MKNGNYYWMDTDFHYGDFSVHKFALIQGKMTDGEKNRETEEVILWFPDDGIDGLIEALKNDDVDLCYELIDKHIAKEIGFIPDYEIN